MNPIEVLMTEHRVIEHVLDALEHWAHGVVTRRADGRAELARFVEFLRGFADDCHHGKEETILFARLIESGFSRDEGPISVMLSEHVQGRRLVSALDRLAQSPTPWTREQTQQLSATVNSYSSMLRAHIIKEDRVLYPMATARLKGELHELERRFRRFEAEETGAGEHQRLHELAERLVERHAPRAHTHAHTPG